MEAVRTPETSVYSNETIWRYIAEGAHLHIRRRENLKSRLVFNFPTSYIDTVSLNWMQMARRLQTK
jgi:hypothetical protein